MLVDIVSLRLCDRILFFRNQIDLKNADPDRVEKQIEKMFDIPSEECIRVSMRRELRNNCATRATMFNSCFLKSLSLDFCKIRHKRGPSSSGGSEENTSVSFPQILLNLFRSKFTPRYLEYVAYLKLFSFLLLNKSKCLV